MARARTRTKTGGQSDAGRVVWTNPSTNLYQVAPGVTTAPLTRVVTQDVVGSPTTDNVFVLERRKFVMQPISGIRSNQGNTWSYEAVGYTPCQDYATVTSNPSLDSRRLKVLNATNPSRPVADLAVTAAELRELPKLIQLAGDTMLKKGSSALLSWQFGWNPLVSDLLDVMDFQKQVDRRVKELTRMHAAGGLRRRRELDSQVGKKKITGFVCNSAFGNVLYSDGRATMTRKSWGTARYLPILLGLPPPTSDQIRAQAIKAVYGLTVDAATAWNLIPWTWLIDWFGNAGDFLENQRNTVGSICVSCCIMTHTEHKINMSGVRGIPGVSGGAHSVLYEFKTRYPGLMPLPELNLGPLITGRQASILGALAITKVPRGALR